MLRSGNPKQTLAAQDALQKLADHDDSRRIINAAAEILADYLQTHKPGPAIATVESVPVSVESASCQSSRRARMRLPEYSLCSKVGL